MKLMQQRQRSMGHVAIFKLDAAEIGLRDNTLVEHLGLLPGTYTVLRAQGQIHRSNHYLWVLAFIDAYPTNPFET